MRLDVVVIVVIVCVAWLFCSCLLLSFFAWCLVLLRVLNRGLCFRWCLGADDGFVEVGGWLGLLVWFGLRLGVLGCCVVFMDGCVVFVLNLLIVLVASFCLGGDACCFGDRLLLWLVLLRFVVWACCGVLFCVSVLLCDFCGLRLVSVWMVV